MNIYELHKRCFLRPLTWEPMPSEDIKKLAHHCRNNFMKALEALKQEHVALWDEKHDASKGYKHYPEECEVCKLIIELEEVQT